MRRASRLFGEVVVGIADSNAKGPWFSADERVEMAREVTKELPMCASNAFVAAAGFSSARRTPASSCAACARSATSEYEFQMAGMNRGMDPSIEVVFPDTI